MSSEHDTDRHSIGLVGKGLIAAVLVAALLAFGSCMAGMGG